MIMDLLGTNLDDLMTKYRKFSLKTTIMITEQVLTRIQKLHERNYLNRDIKPENLAIGLGKMSKTIFMYDFGLSKLYRDARSKFHVPPLTNKSLIGTARYASINTL